MRSLEKWNELKEQLEPIKVKLDKYEANKIALRKNEQNQLWADRYSLEKEMIQSCPHDQVYIFHDSYTDVGYGCDRYYYHDDMYCDRCKTNLTQKTDRRPSSPDQLPYGTKGPFPLFEAVQLYTKRESLTSEELRSFGVRKEIQSITTFRMVQT